jgi:hypothetical protein
MSEAELTEPERKVMRAVETLCGDNRTVNMQTVAHACPNLDVFDLLKQLVEQGHLESVGSFGVRISPNPRTPQPAPVRIPDKPTPLIGTRKPRRASYGRLQGPSSDRIKQMAARILDWLLTNGDNDEEFKPTSTVRALKRALHAYRLPEFLPAMDLLQQRQAIALAGHRVKVLDPLAVDHLPDAFDPDGRKRAKEEREARAARRKKSRPYRPMPEWLIAKWSQDAEQ